MKLLFGRNSCDLRHMPPYASPRVRSSCLVCWYRCWYRQNNGNQNLYLIKWLPVICGSAPGHHLSTSADSRIPSRWMLLSCCVSLVATALHPSA